MNSGRMFCDRVLAPRRGLEGLGRPQAHERLADVRRERGSELPRAVQDVVDGLLRDAERGRAVRAVEGRQVIGVLRVVPGRDQRVDDVRPPVPGGRRGELHGLAAGAAPLGVGQSQPGETASVGAARRYDLLRVHVEKRVVRDQARQVLVVVDLEEARVELRLTGGAAAARLVAEPARGVVHHHVSARREPCVVVVPALAGPEVPALPGELVAGAAAVHDHDHRVAARRGGERRLRDVDVQRDHAVGVRARDARRVRRLRGQGVEAVVLGRNAHAGDAADVGRAPVHRRVAVATEVERVARLRRARRAASRQACRDLRLCRSCAREHGRQQPRLPATLSSPRLDPNRDFDARSTLGQG